MTDPYQRMAQAIEQLVASAPARPTLETLAGQAGLSPGRFQREFSQWVGISPSRFARLLTREKLQAHLLSELPLMEVAERGGLSTPSRLHDLCVAFDAMSPEEYRRAGAGLELVWGRAGSSLGPVFVARSQRGICALEFLVAEDGPDAALQRALKRTRQRWSKANLRRDDGAVASVGEALMPGHAGQVAQPLFVRGTNFQVAVWQALLRIPSGRVISYQQIARALGRPTASRAVANAVGANPLACLIPCHRVIRSSGALGGYRWGIPQKATILVRELSTASPDCGAEAL